MTYFAIDILKFIFALFIVILHTDVFNGSIVEPLLFRLAVPFFFVCSGYFLNNKIIKNPHQSFYQIKPILYKYIRRLGLFLLVFEPIVMILYCIGLYHTYGDIKIVVFQSLRNIIFYPIGALWYIQGVIVACIMLIPFFLKNRIKYALILGIPLFIFALICNRYNFAITPPPFDIICQ